MGWSFRRSVRLGPLRFNLSKSGIGASVGIPGLRAGKDAKGRQYTQISIPGTGIYRRDYYKSSQTMPHSSTVPSGPTVPNQNVPGQPTLPPVPTLPSPNQTPLSRPSSITANNQSAISPGAKYFIFLSTLAAVLWIVLRIIMN